MWGIILITLIVVGRRTHWRQYLSLALDPRQQTCRDGVEHQVSIHTFIHSFD